eukprot:scaffold27115_cov70-Phaeocystis_antarctica.AAC.1
MHNGYAACWRWTRSFRTAESQEKGMRCGARCRPGGRRWRPTAVHAACRRGRDCRLGGSRARGGAHVEHVAHVCDAGGVEAQRLVERRRVLSSVKRRAYDAGRGAGREAGSGGRPRRTQRAGEGSTADWEHAGHGEGRTRRTCSSWLKGVRRKQGAGLSGG